MQLAVSYQHCASTSTSRTRPGEGGIAILPRRITRLWAMGMLLTGRRVPAAEAWRSPGGLTGDHVSKLDAPLVSSYRPGKP